jgi:LysR family transcriptional activator of dmlA
MSSVSDMQFFTCVARHLNLSEAALELGLTASAISRRLARLENRLGVRLLNRTTRRLSLTSDGETFLLASHDIISRVEEAEQSISRARAEPQGLLRVNATFQFGREYIAPVISCFARTNPEVQVQLVLSDAPANIVEEGYDLNIRFGMPSSSRLIVTRLLPNRRVLVAAPSYLQKHGTPTRLKDLTQHQCIVLRQEREAYDIWRFDGGEHVRATGQLSTNDGQIAVNWVLEGHGIMLRSEWDIARHVRAGRLQVVLPEKAHEVGIYAVYPERLNMSAKVRLFIDLLREMLQSKKKELSIEKSG